MFHQKVDEHKVNCGAQVDTSHMAQVSRGKIQQWKPELTFDFILFGFWFLKKFNSMTNLIWYRYSKITQKSGKIQGQISGWIGG